GARGNEALALAGCWAHVFRKFEEAASDHPEANLALKWIGELYDIDEEADGDESRKADLRRTKSAEVIATMKTWLWNQAALKSLSSGRAAAYAIANWDRADAVPERCAHPARQQRHRAKHSRPSRGSQKSLRLEVAPRNRGRG